MTEYIERTQAIDAIEVHMYRQDPDDRGVYPLEDWQREQNYAYDLAMEILGNLPAADVKPVPNGDIGEMSDGYHTFNGLYYQRLILFSALVKAYKDRAWKSWKHEDGEPCFGGGWFIVGIDTPHGSYTYHYEEKDFDLFECEELPVAKHWDGHTEEDVTRLLKLQDVKPVIHAHFFVDEGCAYCSNCRNNFKKVILKAAKFCPMCGAQIDGYGGHPDAGPPTPYDLLHEEGGWNLQ